MYNIRTGVCKASHLVTLSVKGTPSLSVTENCSVDELNDKSHHIRQVISEEDASEPGIVCVDDSGRLFAEQNNHGKMDVWVIETTTPPDKLFTLKTRIEFNVNWCA